MHLIYTLKKICQFILYTTFKIRNRFIDYFKFKKLSVNFPIFTIRNEPGIIGNKCYGNLMTIKHAIGKDFDKNCLIEHGLYFGEYVIENECKIKSLSTIYTFGEYRVKALFNSGIKELNHINIVPIGPYIQYAKNFNNALKRKKIKEKYGSILLIFPYHSSPEIETDYDIQTFIKEINRVKRVGGYNSVFVSMFWLDIKKNKYQRYQNEGFKIVCSGVRNDPYFLSRLKDLIELSDMTMSNDLGTHIGYCISLGKPHYLFCQEIEIKHINEKFLEHSDDTRENKIKKERQLFSKLFSSSDPVITEEQRQVVNYYWGHTFQKRK